MQLLKIGMRHKDVKTLQEILHLKVDGIFGECTLEAVKIFQKENGLVDIHGNPDGIVGPETWAKLLPLHFDVKKSRRTIKEIIVHCTATPEDRDYTVEQIRKQHKQQGWSDIGYHYVIYRDGTVVPGRPVDIAGAHCQGHNTYSIGICYVGGCDKYMHPKDTRTIAQKEALVRALKALKILYPTAKIYGHRDFANKACPSFNATSEYSRI